VPSVDSIPTEIDDLDIQIDGVMGFLMNWLVDFFESDFAS